MNRYVKEFFHRGMMFGGFGPIIMALIYLILHNTQGILFTGAESCSAIISTYLIAFVQAGASVFNQVEHWSLMRSLAWHFSALYLVYVIAYLVNSWLPFSFNALLLFSAIFIAVYLVVWLIVYYSVKSTSKKMNQNVNA